MPDRVAKVCAACNRVLALMTSPNGEETWVHGIQDADHLPIPVLPEQASPVYRCDFCNADESTWRLPVRDFPLPFSSGIQAVLDSRGAPQHMAGEDWAACNDCARRIDTNQWGALMRRVEVCWVRMHGKMSPVIRTQLTSLHRVIRKNITGPLRPLNAPVGRQETPEAPKVQEWAQSRTGGHVGPS